MAKSIRNSDVSRLAKVLIGEPTVLSIVGLNAIVLFINAFPDIHDSTKGVLEWVDYACMVYFVIEAIWKIRIFGWRGYWSSDWNKFDFLVICMGIPLLLNPPLGGDTVGAYTLAPLLRLGRFVRFVRIMRFVPHMNHIARGVTRALKASVGVFLVLMGLLIIMALGATITFGELEQAKEYFGNPFISLYTLFKVFTIEGWYEIPDEMAASGLAPLWVLGLRLFFIMAVTIGGLLGFSLANAVFVDEMTVDNTDDLEKMVTDLREELQSFRQEMQELLQRPDPKEDV